MRARAARLLRALAARLDETATPTYGPITCTISVERSALRTIALYSDAARRAHRGPLL